MCHYAEVVVFLGCKLQTLPPPQKMGIDVKIKAKCIASDSGGRVSVHADVDQRCQRLKCSVQHADPGARSKPSRASPHLQYAIAGWWICLVHAVADAVTRLVFHAPGQRPGGLQPMPAIQNTQCQVSVSTVSPT